MVIGWLPCQQPIRRESDTRSGLREEGGHKKDDLGNLAHADMTSPLKMALFICSRNSSKKFIAETIQNLFDPESHKKLKIS